MRKEKGENKVREVSKNEREEGQQKEQHCCQPATQRHVSHVKGADLPPQNISFWHKDYFRPNIFKKQQTQEKL